MGEEARSRLKAAKARRAAGEELEPGPEWKVVNPEGFRVNKKFVPGTPHMAWKKWKDMQPQVDGMALDIVRHYVHFELDRPLPEQTKDPKNGVLARDNKEDLALMLMKDIKRGACEREDLEVILPFNLAPKPDGSHARGGCAREPVMSTTRWTTFECASKG